MRMDSAGRFADASCGCANYRLNRKNPITLALA